MDFCKRMKMVVTDTCFKHEKVKVKLLNVQFTNLRCNLSCSVSANERHIRVIVQTLIKPSMESHATTAGIEIEIEDCVLTQPF